MAKIIIIVDTHCFEAGAFVWRKNDTPEGPGNGCTLLKVSTLHHPTYLVTLSSTGPKGVFKYVSDAEGAPNHHHNSLILNLACGTSISQVTP